MTLDQLRIFVAVAERQHVTHDAEALNLAQSAASHAIASLEDRHQTKLFLAQNGEEPPRRRLVVSQLSQTGTYRKRSSKRRSIPSWRASGLISTSSGLHALALRTRLSGQELKKPEGRACAPATKRSGTRLCNRSRLSRARMSALFERRRVQGAIPLHPCLPRRAVTPPTGDGWVHEIKHDGFRIVARRDGGRVRLFTRNGYDFTVRFPKIAVAVAGLPVQSCVIDGEAIVVDRQGLSVFDLLRYRRYDHAAVLCAFDLIEHAPASPTRSGTCAVGRRSMISMKYPRCRRQSRPALAMG